MNVTLSGAKGLILEPEILRSAPYDMPAVIARVMPLEALETQNDSLDETVTKSPKSNPGSRVALGGGNADARVRQESGN